MTQDSGGEGRRRTDSRFSANKLSEPSIHWDSLSAPSISATAMCDDLPAEKLDTLLARNGESLFEPNLP
jgi:hypothetical protein